MSYNGSGTFNINTTGQPVVAGTVISSSAFNALTTDLATGLTTAITKDGQTTTTARITFAQGITSSLVTDSSSVSTGSIITGGGVGIAKALYVGTTANVAGAVTLGGIATFSAQPIFSSLTASSAVATDASKGLVSVTNTGTGNNVLATAPTIASLNLTTALTLTGASGTAGQALTSGGSGVAPTWTTISSTPTAITNGTSNVTVNSSGGSITATTAGTAAVTIDTSQNVLVGTTTTTNNLRNGEKVAVVTTGSGTQGGASLTTYSGTGAGSGVIIDIQRSRGTTDGSMTAVASGDTLGYLLFRGSDGTSFQDSSYITGQVDGTVSGGTVPGRLGFITSGTERMRITSGGYLKASDTGSYLSSGGAYSEVNNSNASNPGFGIGVSNASYVSDGIFMSFSQRSSSSTFNAMQVFTSGGNTLYKFRGDGNAYADGTFNNNGADYAEYFESANGQALTVGTTVVLDGNKIREATSQDDAKNIIGVVRPKEPSKASMIVGNTAWNKWANQYLSDDFDRYIMEDHDVVEWTDEDGKTHSYESQSIPSSVTVPSDATRKTHDENGVKFQHYKVNPQWNPDAEYVNRENRPEWNIIGLLGQVKLLKGKPVGDRWTKMRDVSSVVEEWFIR
jgi:hypothetical protein